MPILTKGNPLFTSPASNLSPEQDALRWRALVERVQRLEQMLGKTVKYGQIGAPGGSDIIAQRLRDAGSRFVIDLGNGLATVYDTSNTIRAQMGNLAANGISPAQYGFRANDANGVPLFDSLGLINTMVLLVRGGSGVGQNITSTTPVLLTSSNVSFTLTRATSVFLFFGAAVQAPCTGDGGTDEIDIFVDGVQAAFSAPSLFFPCVTTGAVTSHAGYAPSPLAAGTHNIDLRASRNGTNTVLVLGHDIAAYSMGK